MPRPSAYRQSALFWSKASAGASIYADAAAYSPAQVIPVRWQEVTDEMPSGTNQTQISKAKIWVLDPTVDVDDWLQLLTPAEAQAHAAGTLTAPDDPEAKTGGIQMTTGSPDNILSSAQESAHTNVFDFATRTGITYAGKGRQPLEFRLDGTTILSTTYRDINLQPNTYVRGGDFYTREEAIADGEPASVANAVSGTVGDDRLYAMKGDDGNIWVYRYNLADQSPKLLEIVEPGSQVTTTVPFENTARRIFSRRVLPNLKATASEIVVWVN